MRALTITLCALDALVTGATRQAELVRLLLQK